MNKTQIQVQVLDSTLAKISNLTSTLNLSTKSDVVKMSVDVTQMVAKAIEDGKKVVIRDNNGKESEIHIPGIK